MRTVINRIVIAASASLGGLLLGGCQGDSASSGYHLRGTVVQGASSYIAIVEEDDERLLLPPVEGAALHLQADPGRLQRETIARTASGPDGTFDMKVDKFGAGWLEYDVGLFVRRDGYAPAEHAFELPSESRRIVVVLGRGADRSLDEDPDDLRDEASRYLE